MVFISVQLMKKLKQKLWYLPEDWTNSAATSTLSLPSPEVCLILCLAHLSLVTSFFGAQRSVLFCVSGHPLTLLMPGFVPAPTPRALCKHH